MNEKVYKSGYLGIIRVEMETVHAKVRSWGRSLGIVIPKGAVIKEGIKDGDNLEFFIKKEEENSLKKTFGSLKMKTPTEQLLKEADEELWDD